MTHPTMLNPWYVVVRSVYDLRSENDGVTMEYYCHTAEGNGTWSRRPVHAMLFMRLNDAARIAKLDAGSLVQVIYDKDGYDLFRPKEVL